MTDEKRDTVTDRNRHNLECPYCGTTMELGEIMRDADFEGDTFYDCVRDYINPWDGGDGFACIPYSCHCPLCGKYMRAEILCRHESIELQDDECDTVDMAEFRVTKDNKIVYTPTSVNAIDAINEAENALDNLERFVGVLNDEEVKGSFDALIKRFEVLVAEAEGKLE